MQPAVEAAAAREIRNSQAYGAIEEPMEQQRKLPEEPRAGRARGAIDS